jgi:FkbM family methyltransferase
MILTRLKKKFNQSVHGAAEAIALFLVRFFRLDSRRIFYENSGILKYHDWNSGENWFINRVLPRLLGGINRPVLLDIGANIGNYSFELAKAIPSCCCYALEPNPVTFEQLVARTREVPNIVCINCGAGSESRNLSLFVYRIKESTGHASLYKEVFTDIHHQDDKSITNLDCTIEKIDTLMQLRSIDEQEVHFIKIDAEGHELEALKGSLNIIEQGCVRAVQFEFNEMNIISRVFLKDFYDLLGQQWTFYRLDTQKLIPLGDRYDPGNETFKYQNIIAIHQSFLYLLGA